MLYVFFLIPPLVLIKSFWSPFCLLRPHLFLHLCPSFQLLQACVQKAKTSVPEWILLQLPGLPVHPQLHEVELRSGEVRERGGRCHVLTFWPQMPKAELTETKSGGSASWLEGRRIYFYTWWQLTTSSTWGSLSWVMWHSSRETLQRIIWALPGTRMLQTASKMRRCIDLGTAPSCLPSSLSQEHNYHREIASRPLILCEHNKAWTDRQTGHLSRGNVSQQEEPPSGRGGAAHAWETWNVKRDNNNNNNTAVSELFQNK